MWWKAYSSNLQQSLQIQTVAPGRRGSWWVSGGKQEVNKCSLVWEEKCSNRSWGPLPAAYNVVYSSCWWRFYQPNGRKWCQDSSLTLGWVFWWCGCFWPIPAPCEQPHTHTSVSYSNQKYLISPIQYLGICYFGLSRAPFLGWLDICVVFP